MIIWVILGLLVSIWGIWFSKRHNYSGFFALSVAMTLLFGAMLIVLGGNELARIQYSF